MPPAARYRIKISTQAGPDDLNTYIYIHQDGDRLFGNFSIPVYDDEAEHALNRREGVLFASSVYFSDFLDDSRGPLSCRFLWLDRPSKTLSQSGKITFWPGKEISGYFNMMYGDGIPDGKLNFFGGALDDSLSTPQLLAWTVDQWNEYNVFEAEENILFAEYSEEDYDDPEFSDLSEDPDFSDFFQHPELYQSQPSVYDEEENVEPSSEAESALIHHDAFVAGITSTYKIYSSSLESGGVHKKVSLQFMLHIEREEEELWGYFNFGHFDGTLLFTNCLTDLSPNTILRFRWRGKDYTEPETKHSGRGYILIDETYQIKGRIGSFSFEGRRHWSYSPTAEWNTRSYEALWDEGWMGAMVD